MKDATILIVDDQAVNIALLEDILTEAGYKNVVGTTDPYRVAPLYQDIQPDLILLDLAMPGLDGFAVLDVLRPLIAEQGYVPVLVLTADITRQAKERALRGGAKDFLTKPFDVTEVLLRIGNLIETRRLHRRLREHAELLEERVRARTRELEDQVTERTQAEIALRESEARYRQLIDATFDLVSSVAEDGRFLFVNRAWIDTLGYSAEEALSMSVWEGVPEDERESVKARLPEMFVGDDRKELQGSIVCKDGRILSVEGSVTPGTMPDGSRCVHAFVRDVTERKRADRAQRDKEIAEARSSAKSAMLANLSHELRTPLNSIIGFGRVLEAGSYGPLNERQASYVQHIVRAGEHMLSLVNDILDLRRVEENALALEIHPVPLGAAIEDAEIMVAALVSERLHALRSRVAPGTPPALADRDSLVQVLVNLLSNAAKYTDPGGSIEIRARAAGEMVEVEVEDNGIGIKPEEHERVFDYFFRVGGKRTHQVKGFGIGLALTRRLVEAMNGSISLQSAPGVGTTFRFTLPAALVADGSVRRVP